MFVSISDQVKSEMLASGSVGSLLTVKQWASLLGRRYADVSNAIAKHEDLKLHIKRERPPKQFAKFPIEEFRKKMDTYSEKKTVSQWAQILGITSDGFRHLLRSYPDLEKYRIKNSDLTFKSDLEVIDRVFDGTLKRIKEWEDILGHKIYYPDKLETKFGKKLFFYPDTESRITEIKESEPHTLTYWSDRWGISISAACHFVNRNGLRHLLRKPTIEERAFKKLQLRGEKVKAREEKRKARLVVYAHKKTIDTFSKKTIRSKVRIRDAHELLSILDALNAIKFQELSTEYKFKLFHTFSRFNTELVTLSGFKYEQFDDKMRKLVFNLR